MSHRRLFAVLLLTLAGLGLLGSGGPAWAHSALDFGSDAIAETAPGASGIDARTDGDDLPGWALVSAPETPGLPWAALLVVAAAVALGSWRPRRAAALALVLLLGIFAFEDGVHSVHHGLDQAQKSSCPVAAAGTQLSATAVDGVPTCDVTLPLVALAIEMGPSDPIARLASPEQGRAPPHSLL